MRLRIFEAPRPGPGVRTCRDQCGANVNTFGISFLEHDHRPGHRINKKRKASILCRSIESIC